MPKGDSCCLAISRICTGYRSGHVRPLLRTASAPPRLPFGGPSAESRSRVEELPKETRTCLEADPKRSQTIAEELSKGNRMAPFENKLNPSLSPTLLKLLMQVRQIVIMSFAQLPRPEFPLTDQPIILGFRDTQLIEYISNIKHMIQVSS